MNYEFQIENGHIMVLLAGAIYTEDAEKLRGELQEYLAQGYSRFLIDMEQVDYLDSAGIATLIALHKGAGRQGGRVTLRGVNGLVKELFEITLLTEVFEMQ